MQCVCFIRLDFLVVSRVVSDDWKAVNATSYCGPQLTGDTERIECSFTEEVSVRLMLFLN